MSKSFYPETGYMVRSGSCWYDHRVMLTLEAGERIEIFRRPYAGKSGIRLGTYLYDQLDAENPPIGLRLVDEIDSKPLPFSIVGNRRA
jgi:hypothetical protein